MHFPMSLRLTVPVDRKPPCTPKRLYTKCPKFKQQSAITSKRYEIGCQFVLITNRMLHTVFRLVVVPTSVTLNELEWRNSPYFAVFHRIR